MGLSRELVKGSTCLYNYVLPTKCWYYGLIRTDIAYGCQTVYDKTVISKLRQQRRSCTKEEICVRFPWNRLTVRTLYKIRAYFLSIYFIKHIRVFFFLKDLSKRRDFIWKKGWVLRCHFSQNLFVFYILLLNLKRTLIISFLSCWNLLTGRNIRTKVKQDVISRFSGCFVLGRGLHYKGLHFEPYKLRPSFLSIYFIKHMRGFYCLSDLPFLGDAILFDETFPKSRCYFGIKYFE